MKRYLILAACITMLVCLGTGQAWSAFVGPLRKDYPLSDFETQLVFNTSTFTFCLMLIFAGRLHDRLGPRPLTIASAVIVACAWTLAWFAGSSYFFLWLAIGVLGGAGNAVGYVCPIATAVKWFPNRKGLISGLAAAGFAGGPVVLSLIVEILHAQGWHALSIFGLIGSIYAPIVLVTGLCLALPPGQPGADEVDAFRRRSLLVDRRFWTLFVGMFCGTLPFLTVMGSVKQIGEAFNIGAAAVAAVSAMAVGNACGRVFWGQFIDRLGARRSMLSAQSVMLAAMLCLILLGWRHPALFLAAACVVGFCYGSNFAIYPAATAKLYGTHVLGSVYPLIMAAQGISSFAPSVNGMLYDRTGSYFPGLTLAALIAALGLIASTILSRPMAEENRGGG